MTNFESVISATIQFAFSGITECQSAKRMLSVSTLGTRRTLKELNHCSKRIAHTAIRPSFRRVVVRAILRHTAELHKRIW